MRYKLINIYVKAVIKRDTLTIYMRYKNNKYVSRTT